MRKSIDRFRFLFLFFSGSLSLFLDFIFDFADFFLTFWFDDFANTFLIGIYHISTLTTFFYSDWVSHLGHGTNSYALSCHFSLSCFFLNIRKDEGQRKWEENEREWKTSVLLLYDEHWSKKGRHKNEWALVMFSFTFMYFLMLNLSVVHWNGWN